MPDAPKLIDLQQLAGPETDASAFWEALIREALHARTSDVHLMAQADATQLALRVDGELWRQGELDDAFARRLISHVKTQASIDIAERRRPTEGRIRMDLGDRAVDMRVSCVPSLHGQDLVVRLFDRGVNLLELDELGLLREQIDGIHDFLARPTGLILVTGPTGSGKTTTLYAMLRHLAGGTRKVMTIEDPIEYDLDLVNQTQVSSRIDVTFASLLVALLRQDPDVIMVGEVRDRQTAQTAVRAANTGHLVLATTHAVKASRAVETMLSLEVEPYFLAMALRGVIAQVLVKRICPDCRTPLPETHDMIVDTPVLKRLPSDTPSQLYQGTGCDNCHHTGYHGRMGLFELFSPDDAMRQLILSRSSATAMDEAIDKAGKLTLAQAGKLAAVQGQTTMEELLDALPEL